MDKEELRSKIVQLEQEIKFYERLNQESPNRQIGTTIKLLKVKRYTLDELLL